MGSLLNIAQVAQEWGVRRLGVASTVGVYLGVEGGGRFVKTPHLVQDITRLVDDTGYQPLYDTEKAVADYIAWLWAGNPA